MPFVYPGMGVIRSRPCLFSEARLRDEHVGERQ